MSLQIKPIQALLLSKKTVFSTKDLALLWEIQSEKQLKDKVRYYTKSKQIRRISKGIFSLSDDYNTFELAQKIQTPSYISLETALRYYGVIQQFSEIITCIGTYPRRYKVDGNIVQYHQMSRALFSCPIGIQNTDVCSIAVPERALIDSLYLGFQPDIGKYQDWDIQILETLEQEFSIPRVTVGLHTYGLLI